MAFRKSWLLSLLPLCRCVHGKVLGNTTPRLPRAFRGTVVIVHLTSVLEMYSHHALMHVCCVTLVRCVVRCMQSLTERVDTSPTAVSPEESPTLPPSECCLQGPGPTGNMYSVVYGFIVRRGFPPALFYGLGYPFIRGCAVYGLH